MPTHGGNGPALPGPRRACFSAARVARAASGSDGVGTSPQRDFRVYTSDRAIGGGLLVG